IRLQIGLHPFLALLLERSQCGAGGREPPPTAPARHPYGARTGEGGRYIRDTSAATQGGRGPGRSRGGVVHVLEQGIDGGRAPFRIVTGPTLRVEPGARVPFRLASEIHDGRVGDRSAGALAGRIGGAKNTGRPHLV